jgi:hypothetical protein
MTEPTLPHAAGRLSRLTPAFALAGAFLFLYLRNFLVRGIPFEVLGDQHQFFARAVRIVHGQVPYRDFFAFITPGTEYLYAAGFRVFGVHAWLIAAWTVVVGLAFCWLLTWMAARLLPARLCLLPALFFLAFDFLGSSDLTHHWFSTLAALAAAAVLMRGVSIARIATAGALCAVAALFTQTAGSAAFLAIAFYVVWQAYAYPQEGNRSVPTRLVALFLPFAVILATVLGFFARAAGLYQLFFDLVLFAPRYFDMADKNLPSDYLHQFPPVHSASDLLRFIPVLFIYVLVPCIYAVGLFRIARGRVTLPAQVRQNLMLLNLVGLGLFLSIVHAARYFRLSTVAAPAILVCVWLLSEPGRVRMFLRNAMAVTALAFALILPIHRQMQWHGVLDLPTGRTAFIDRLAVPEFAWMAAHTHPSDSIFNNSTLSLYLSLRNPTGLEYITPRKFTRPEWADAALAAMRRDPPHFVLLQPQDTTVRDSADNSGPIRQFVQENYDCVAVFPQNQGVPYREGIWEWRGDAHTPIAASGLSAPE